MRYGLFLIKNVVVCVGLLGLVGCRRYDFSISQQIINRDYLASSHVNTPDPRLCCPPCGRSLIMSWHIPKEIFLRSARIELDVIYWNYTEGHFTYPIEYQKGYVLYTLVGEEYEEKQGLLTYRARLVTEDGYVYRNWTQQLWVDLIHFDEEPFHSPQKPDFPEEPQNE